MSDYTALFDACVLYPQTLRDVLLSLARTELFRARWSADINDEWTRNRLARNPQQSAQIRRTLELVNQSVPDCLVTGYEPLIEGIVLPDPNDRHVVAAAIIGRADVIVTTNLRHFPAEILSPFNIEAQHPRRVRHPSVEPGPRENPICLQGHEKWLIRPPMSPDEFLENLEKKGLARTVAELRRFVTML